MEFDNGRIRLGLGSLAASPLPGSTGSLLKVVRTAIVFLLTVLAFSLSLAAPSYAATLTVCASGCGYTTVAAAISAASAGDTISITDAGHTEWNITIDRNLTIHGLGATNTAIDGGAQGSVFIINAGVTATIQDMTIRNGIPLTYQASGGGILNYGTLTVANSTISGNASANNGGGIFNNAGTLTVSNSTISGNNSASGGGIGSFQGTLTISNSTLSGNSTYEYDGGAMFNYNGTATISNSTISGNHATRFGGGLSDPAYGNLTISNSTISGNSADDSGGGIIDDGQLTITNSTISGNSALIHDCGGIYKTPAYGGPLTISNSTISGNSAPRNGGGICNLSSATVKNSIVGNNSARTGGDCYFNNPLTALGANLDTDGSCGSTNFTQVTSAQLALGMLALNPPGTTETLALLSGSVAIDAVTDCTDAFGAPVTTDQRGVPRPQGPACDIGAYEFGVADITPPAISIVAPTATTYLLNQSVAASYTCSDPDDAVTLCAGPVADGANIDTASVGAKTFTVNAADSHSNTSSQSVNYNVAYKMCTDYDTSHSKQRGSTVPIKLEICDLLGLNQSASSIVLHATGVTMVSNNASETLADSGNANPDDDFRLIGGPEYIFNLSTSGYPGGTFALQFTVSGDPTTHSALFQLK